jgi:hypothetical protein
MLAAWITLTASRLTDTRSTCLARRNFTISCKHITIGRCRPAACVHRQRPSVDGQLNMDHPSSRGIGPHLHPSARITDLRRCMCERHVTAYTVCSRIQFGRLVERTDPHFPTPGETFCDLLPIVAMVTRTSLITRNQRDSLGYPGQLQSKAAHHHITHASRVRIHILLRQ